MGILQILVPISPEKMVEIEMVKSRKAKLEADSNLEYYLALSEMYERRISRLEREMYEMSGGNIIGSAAFPPASSDDPDVVAVIREPRSR